MTSDLASTWATIAGDAMLLDPAAIRATIRSTLDDGLRAARYDGIGGRGGEQMTHQERALQRHYPGQFPKGDDDKVEDTRGSWSGRRDPSWADLDAIDHHVSRFVTAVAELAIRSHSNGAPEDWDEAVQDAHLLAEMDAIGVLERIPGSGVSRWVHTAGDAVHDLGVIARRHEGGRAPTEDEKHWHRENVNDLCVWHLDVAPKGRYRRPRLPGLNICQSCRTLAEMGDRKPPAWLLEAEVEREGKPRAWTAALSRYADELGIARDRSA